MSFFRDFATAMNDYVADSVSMTITDLTLVNGTSGAINVREEWMCKVTVTNDGELNMTEVTLHVLADNDTQVSTTGNAGSWEDDVIVGPFDVGASDTESSDWVYFKLRILQCLPPARCSGPTSITGKVTCVIFWIQETSTPVIRL